MKLDLTGILGKYKEDKYREPPERIQIPPSSITAETKSHINYVNSIEPTTYNAMTQTRKWR